MANQTRWYTTLEAVKRLPSMEGVLLDAIITEKIEGATAEIERLTNRRFIPLTATKYYPWPQRGGRGWYLMIEQEEPGAGGGDLLAVTALTKDGVDLTAIASTNYFAEPINDGPPYTRIEIDLASSAFFASHASTPQRGIAVTGRWGYSEDTRAAGTVASGLSSSASATSGVCSDASLIGVGDTLKIESEALFVSAKGTVDTTANTAGALTASKPETTVPINTGSLVKAGEVILIDSERMFVESVSGNNLTVVRAWDGSTLATHANPSDVYAFRTLTLVRGINGTTAAVHADATAITRYAPPSDIVSLCREMVIAELVQSRGGWTGAIGAESAAETRMFNLRELRDRVVRTYKKRATVAV